MTLASELGPAAGARTGTLPNLLVIGARKAGTTSLWAYLDDHPEIFMSPVKEIHFFDRDENWTRGVDWYSSHFDTAAGQPVVGEATPAYTRYPSRAGVPERAARVVPDARLVYLVRDPIARIRAHWLHDWVHGYEDMPFERAVLQRADYVDTSSYAMQVRRWLRHYPEDRLLVVSTEQLATDRDATMAQVYGFLGVSPEHSAPDVQLNQTAGKQQLRPAGKLAREPRVQAVARLVPSAVRRRVKSRADGLLHRQVDKQDAEVTPQLREALAQLLRDDVRELRRWMPADFDGWGIA